jgi:hypothetical protein
MKISDLARSWCIVQLAVTADWESVSREGTYKGKCQYTIPLVNSQVFSLDIFSFDIFESLRLFSSATLNPRHLNIGDLVCYTRRSYMLSSQLSVLFNLSMTSYRGKRTISTDPRPEFGRELNAYLAPLLVPAHYCDLWVQCHFA